ncbi:MAG: hypothetical protein ACREOG_23365, partial [Gemmatimonadaceae bacterium]
ILLASGHALVADFGIARAVGDTGERLTATGLALGTPSYMSRSSLAGSPSSTRGATSMRSPRSATRCSPGSRPSPVPLRKR